MADWLKQIVGGSAQTPDKRHGHKEPPRPHVQAKLPPLRRQPTAIPDWRARIPYKKGERIGGLFDIYKILGRGGFGIVYLVYDHELKKLCALKTFRDELLADAAARSSFKREASRWVDLGDYPYIVSALSVVEILQRLYVRMDYIAPDDDGRVSLADYLRGNTRRLIELEEQLEWGIEFCLGMEHANQRGIHCHRDIKPDNILITSDGFLKISDFGLAVVSETVAMDSHKPGAPSGNDHIGLSIVKTAEKKICGTPGYIPPEVYRNATADVRSDIYSFGLVLWQMAAQSPTPPFCPNDFRGDMDAYLQAVYQAQTTSALPTVEGPMQPVIAKCLSPKPADRYANFAELRNDLEPLLRERFGKSVRVPDKIQNDANSWYQRGNSLGYIGRFDDSLVAFEEGLRLDPLNHKLLVGKAKALCSLGRFDEALVCCVQVLQMNPKYLQALMMKGFVLLKFKQIEAALECFEQHIALWPSSFTALHNRNICLENLGRLDEALAGCDKVIKLQPRHPKSWHLKGKILAKQGKYEESIACFDQALIYDPQFADALLSKGHSLSKIKQLTNAINCFDAALAIDERIYMAWFEKGRVLIALKKYQNSIECYEKALSIHPNFAMAWFNKGVAEDNLHDFRAAIGSFSRFLQLAQSEHQHRVPAVQARIQKLRAKFH